MVVSNLKVINSQSVLIIILFGFEIKSYYPKPKDRSNF